MLKPQPAAAATPNMNACLNILPFRRGISDTGAIGKWKSLNIVRDKKIKLLESATCSLFPADVPRSWQGGFTGSPMDLADRFESLAGKHSIALGNSTLRTR